MAHSQSGALGTGGRATADRLPAMLLRAIRMLPQKEQDAVVRALLKACMEGGVIPDPLTLVPPPAWQVPSPLGHMHPGTAAGGQPGSTVRMMPVRLPEDQYDQFKSWCADHGFSMAVVIRGLVERFLVQQAG